MRILTLFLTLAVWLQTGCIQNYSSTSPIDTSGVPSSKERAIEDRPGDANLIEPGKRIGPIYLATDFENAFSILGKPFFDHTYEPPVCGSRWVRWLVNDTDGDKPMLLATFSANGEITQLHTQMQGYETAEGVRNGDTLQEFASKYDTKPLEVYADRGLKSNSKHVEGYSAYLVDSSRGVAFEFTKSRDDKRWYINSIGVFDPQEDFSNWRYCDPSEKARWWVKLNSFDLDSAPELRDE